MREWILKFASYREPDDIFDFVASGEKTIETRSYNPTDKQNYALVKPGDIVVFVSLDTGKRITKTVTFMHKYPSVEEMVKHEPVENIFPTLNTPEQLLSFYREAKELWGNQYAENLEKHGIVAIGFK